MDPMSLPRPIHPGITYLLTRRCLLRTHLLRPSEELNQIFLFCLAVAAEKFGVEIHAFCVLSNHYHIVATDALGQLPAFMHWLNAHLAKTVNSLLGRTEAVWSQSHYSAVRLAQAEDVLDKMVYVYANPVKAHLVRQAEDWPGMISLPEDLDATVFSADRPVIFFRKTGPVPSTAALRLTVPPALAHLTLEELIEQLRSRLDQRQQEIRHAARNARQPVLGRRAVLDQSPFTVSTHQEPRRGLNPRVACKNPERRSELLQQFREFVRSYREAWTAFCHGVENVLFPSGTYLLRLRQGVACGPAP